MIMLYRQSVEQSPVFSWAVSINGVYAWSSWYSLSLRKRCKVN